METRRRAIFLVYPENEKWRGEQREGSCVTSLHGQKEDAIADAIARALRRPPSTVEVMERDGKTRSVLRCEWFTR